MKNPGYSLGCTISTVGTPGKASVFFPRSKTQRAARRKSSPKMQESCTAATYTLKVTDSPSTRIVTTHLPSIGASSPVTVRRFTTVGSDCIPVGTTSGLTSVAVEPVSTRARARVMGTWQKSPTWVQPTTLADSAASSASGGSGAPLPRLYSWALSRGDKEWWTTSSLLHRPGGVSLNTSSLGALHADMARLAILATHPTHRRAPVRTEPILQHGLVQSTHSPMPAFLGPGPPEPQFTRQGCPRRGRSEESLLRPLSLQGQLQCLLQGTGVR